MKERPSRVLAAAGQYPLASKPGTLIALVVLAISGGLAIASLRGDALIVDEVAHLPAGYSYVTRGDMRLNPEHPPLTKDVAGLAVVLWSKVTKTPVAFPNWLPSWTSWTNAQWDFGPAFLFSVNHHVRDMLFWARLPTVLIFLGFGWWLFAWTRRRWGQPAALLTLLLYAFSPTVLAHARFVTTDLAAAAAAFVSAATFAAWLERPRKRTLLIAAFWLGVAELTKFSLLVLVPVFILATILWSVLGADQWASARQLTLKLFQQFGQCLLMIALAFSLVVLPVYVAHTWNEPPAKQLQDLKDLFPADQPKAIGLLRWLDGKPILRGAGQYLTGVLMVQQRATVGSVTFFRGEDYLGGRTAYFPTLYLAKEPLGFHLLTLAALAAFIAMVFRRRQGLSEIKLAPAAPGLVFGLFVAAFWTVSVMAKLNIGVRHVLPTYPFIFVLVSYGVIILLGWQRQRSRLRWQVASAAVGVLLAWQLVSVVRLHPSYLAYFNELAGGSNGGRRISVDSNLDWGQDLLRLGSFVRQRQIQHINVDYFGKDQPEQVMPGVARVYHVEQGPIRGWLAVSRTYLESERGRASPSFPKGPNRYAWLDAFLPVAVIGHSIAVYYIP